MRRTLLSAVALAAAVLVAPGCRPGTALGNRYNNFRAFYNTYYNASRSLEQGEEALQNDAAAVDRSQLLRVFPVTGGGAGGPFEDAVEKSAELLRNRPTSKWADDALLVIGKAYFYQRNFAGAEQKFQETAAAAETTGDRRLGDEAQFWLGRTYAATERYDEGVEVLQDGLAREDVDRRWRSRMRLALGELYALAGRWDEAAEVLGEGAPEVGDGDLAARAYVLLGQVEEYAGRYEEAAGAYSAALDERPPFELAYAAAVNRALVVGLDGGDTDRALGLVGRMQGDDKFYERRGELALVRARLLAAAGRSAEARAQFLDVLYDPELDGQRVRGEAHYRLGEFYRDAAGDYVRASAHFDTAATALREPPTEASTSRTAVLGVNQQARTYAALAETARRVEEADSLLALGALSDEAFAARIEVIEAERLRVYREQQRRLDAERAAQAFSGEGARFQDDPAAPPRPNAALQAPAPVGGANAGFLSYRDPNTIQAGLIAFEQRWGSRPLVPNWRRRAAISASGLASDVGGVGDETQGVEAALGSGLPRLDISRVPRTPEKREEINTQLAQLRYELANAFFLSLGRADTAAALYRRILDETPDLPAAVRARYALAEIERAAGREDVARPLYEEVVAAAPDGDLARASRARLGADEDRPAPTEATAETSAAYDAIRARWRGGAALEAAAAFVALGDADPDSAQAGRAYLAAAAAYAEWAEGDSLALTGPLPDSLVSSVLSRVPRAPAPRPAPDSSDAAPRAGLPAPVGGVAPASPLPRPQRRAADSLNVPAYVTAVPDEAPAPDSLAAPPPDPLAAPPPDPLAAPPAPQAVLPTPGTAQPDSSQAPTPLAGEGGAVADSAAFTLRDHLHAIVALYPGTAYADRAVAMQVGLPAPPSAGPAGDPYAALRPGAPEAAPADSLAASPDEALEVSVEPDFVEPDVTDSGLAEGGVAPAQDEPFPGLRGTAPIDPSQGGVTWRLRTLSIPTEGEALERGLRRSGFRAAVVTDGAAYYVIAGQFETEDDAEGAREALPVWAQARAEVVPVGDFSVVPRSAGGEGDFRP